MDISIAGFFGNSPHRDLAYIKDFSQTIESLGFKSLSLPEHVIFFAKYESSYPYTEDGKPNWDPETGIYDPLFVAQVASQHTSTLRFVTGVLILTQRPALLTAKEVLTLDHLSNGRFDLGVGSGWSWEEYAALGVPFENRGRRVDEYIESMRIAWREERATYHGQFVNFENVVLNPKPISEGGPPILIGGDSTAAMKRAARLGDGWYGWWAQPDIEQHLNNLRSIMNDAGRDVSDDDFSFRLGLPLKSLDPQVINDHVQQATDLGIDELILAPPIPVRDFDRHLSSVAGAAGLI